MYMSLQGCRAIAAALVVLFHLGGTFAQDRYFGFKALDGPFAWGDAGVDFFFVLSGFLITSVHRSDFGRPRALRDYVLKRTLRIYPTYWLICFAVVGAAVVFPALRAALPTDPLVFLKGLALLPQDPDVVGGTGSPILFVAWSLQYEMLFYAIIGVVIVNRVAGALVAAALLALYFGCQFGSSCTFPQTFLTNGMIFLFCIGVVSAYVVRSSLRLPLPLVVATAAAVGFVAFGWHEVAVGRDAVVVDRRLVYGVLSCLIIVGLVQAEDEGRFALKHPMVGLLGDASYSLYLMHIPIISVLCKVVLQLGIRGPSALIAAFALIFLACVVASVLFHRLVERPLLRWLRRHVTHSRKPVGAAEAAADVSVDATLVGSHGERLR